MSQPASGARPLWCAEPACLVVTDKTGPNRFRCPKCGKVYPWPETELTPANVPEMFPRRAPKKAPPAQKTFRFAK